MTERQQPAKKSLKSAKSTKLANSAKAANSAAATEPARVVTPCDNDVIWIGSSHRARRGHSEHDRHFIGLVLDAVAGRIDGSLLRIWGARYQLDTDVVATAKVHDRRLTTLAGDLFASTSQHIAAAAAIRAGIEAVEVSEIAMRVIQPLVAQLKQDETTLRTIGLLDFGSWRQDALGQWSFLPACDTAALAAASGLTIVDNFAGTDLAARGRGGPCDGAPVWLMLADRGLVPGRVVRGLLDLDATARLYLLPPRDGQELPTQLTASDVVPAARFLRVLTDRITAGRVVFDGRETWSVQGRRIVDLIDAWRQAADAGDWICSPAGCDSDALLQLVDNWQPSLLDRPCDVLCSAIHWIADQVASWVHRQVPRSQPIGQMVLAGELRHHAFLQCELRRRMPEIEFRVIDDFGFSVSNWRSVAAALLGTLHVDQMTGNSPSLTGCQIARVLGRITPGSPSNWHRVLAEMARTLPEKKTLRNAV